MSRFFRTARRLFRPRLVGLPSVALLFVRPSSEAVAQGSEAV